MNRDESSLRDDACVDICEIKSRLDLIEEQLAAKSKTETEPEIVEEPARLGWVEAMTTSHEHATAALGVLDSYVDPMIARMIEMILTKKEGHRLVSHHVVNLELRLSWCPMHRDFSSLIWGIWHLGDLMSQFAGRCEKTDSIAVAARDTWLITRSNLEAAISAARELTRIGAVIPDAMSTGDVDTTGDET